MFLPFLSVQKYKIIQWMIKKCDFLQKIILWFIVVYLLGNI